MSEAELKALTESLVEEMRPFVQFGKIIRWIIGAVASAVIGVAGIAVWVNNVTKGVAQTAQDITTTRQEMLQYEASRSREAKDWEKGFNEWRLSKDSIDIRLITIAEQFQKISDRQQAFIDSHGPPSEKNPH